MVTVGGGDDLWLFVNKVLVLQLATRVDSILCRKINLTQSQQTGNYNGVSMKYFKGTISDLPKWLFDESTFLILSFKYKDYTLNCSPVKLLQPHNFIY